MWRLTDTGNGRGEGKAKQRRSGDLSSRWAGGERQISRDGRLHISGEISRCKSGSGDGNWIHNASVFTVALD